MGPGPTFAVGKEIPVISPVLTVRAVLCRERAKAAEFRLRPEGRFGPLRCCLIPLRVGSDGP